MSQGDLRKYKNALKKSVSVDQIEHIFNGDDDEMIMTEADNFIESPRGHSPAKQIALLAPQPF